MFRRVGVNRFNFRCPFCGDSKKNARAARGNISPSVKDRSKLAFKCFNCGKGPILFQTFLRELDPVLHSKYLMDHLKGSDSTQYDTSFWDQHVSDEPPRTSDVLTVEDLFVPLLSLEEDHPARLYVSSRWIPDRICSRVWYTDKFKAAAQKADPTKYVGFTQDEERIVFPIIYENRLVGFQGRSIDPSCKVRYIGIAIDRTVPRFFGQEQINTTLPVIIVEGPIDSLFLENCVASCGAHIGSDLPWPQRVFYLDQEPRNKQIVKRIEELIDAGEPVAILPPEYIERDVNELVQIGYNPTDIRETVLSHTYSGASARLRLSSWKRT